MSLFKPAARNLLIISVGAVALGLASCGGRDAKDDIAEAQPAAPNVEAATAPAPDMASSPFMSIEMAMNEKMMAAVSSSPEHTWAMKMLAHHQGAIDMSLALLAKSPNGPMQKMAQKTIDDQTKDIAELQTWLRSHKAPAGANADPFGKTEKRMHERMMAAMGANLDQTWAHKMIEHHQGAVDTAKIVLEKTTDAELKRIAQMTSDKQTKEIAMLRAMSAG